MQQHNNKKGIEAAAHDALKHLRGAKVVGLGSGSSAAEVVRAMKGLKNRDFACVATSLQIKIEAERSGLVIGDESLIPDTDVVFDGADQIDASLNMIKGGGGALLREKILISAARKVVILASASKFVEGRLERAIPVEVHPMARSIVSRRLSQMGTKAELRLLDKGYPFVTENGNIILDATLGKIENPAATEAALKCIPGVIEVGIFTRPPNPSYYKIGEDSYDEIVQK